MERGSKNAMSKTETDSQLLLYNTGSSEEPDKVEGGHYRQYLVVLATSVSPARLFSSVGFVKSNLWGNHLDTTSIT